MSGEEERGGKNWRERGGERIGEREREVGKEWG